MPKYKFKLIAICEKEYILDAKDKNDAELKAIEDFKKNVYANIDEYNSFGEGFKIVN